MIKKKETVIKRSLLEHIYKTYSTDADRIDALIEVFDGVPGCYQTKRRWELERLEAERERRELEENTSDMDYLI